MKKVNILIIVMLVTALSFSSLIYTASAEEVLTVEYSESWSIYYRSWGTQEENAHYINSAALLGIDEALEYTLSVTECDGLSLNYEGDYTGTVSTGGGMITLSFVAGGVLLIDNATAADGVDEAPLVITYAEGSSCIVIMSPDANTLTAFSAILDDGVIPPEPSALEAILDAMGAAVRGFGGVLADAADGAISIIWDGTDITIYGALIIVGVGWAILVSVIMLVLGLLSKIGGGRDKLRFYGKKRARK